LRKFIDLGCAACHNGAGIGGNSFQKFGVAVDYWKETGAKEPDKGRADVTKNDADLYVFKVPSLRNAAKTAPYFHDGSVYELKRAVTIMGKTQLGIDISEKDADAIVAFLGALTGPVPANYPRQSPIRTQRLRIGFGCRLSRLNRTKLFHVQARTSRRSTLGWRR
jgi:cytochrome c peroxidase